MKYPLNHLFALLILAILSTSELFAALDTITVDPGSGKIQAAINQYGGDVVYRLRLGEVQESHEGWLRVNMDVVGREQFAAAA